TSWLSRCRLDPKQNSMATKSFEPASMWLSLALDGNSEYVFAGAGCSRPARTFPNCSADIRRTCSQENQTGLQETWTRACQLAILESAIGCRWSLVCPQNPRTSFFRDPRKPKGFSYRERLESTL